MAWYDLPGAMLGGARDKTKDMLGGFFDSLDRTQNRWSQVDPNNQLGGIAGQAQQGYTQAGQQLGDVIAGLQRQASGQESLSQLQLGQALARNQAQQRAMAASASPSNAAMAARTAAIQSARLGSGLAGQQAMAGLQERQNAIAALGQLLGAERAQGLQGALGGYGAIENARTNRFTGALGQPTTGERVMGGIKDAFQAAMSDRRLKTDIKDGGDDAQAFLDGLKAYRFKYKDAKHGDGEQLGIMAQDLSKDRLGRRAVIETPEGKAVHGARLATALAAAAAQMNQRLKKLEGNTDDR